MPEGAKWEDTTWGKCSVCGRKGGVVIVKEVPLEPELTEEIEAVEEVIEEAVEAEIEASIPEEREPEETAVEAEPKEFEGIQDTTALKARIRKMPVEAEPEAVTQQAIGEAAILDAGGTVPTEQPLEAESEPSVKIKIELDTEEMDKKLADRTAKIEALKAQLAKLEPEAE